MFKCLNLSLFGVDFLFWAFSSMHQAHLWNGGVRVSDDSTTLWAYSRIWSCSDVCGSERSSDKSVLGVSPLPQWSFLKSAEWSAWLGSGRQREVALSNSTVFACSRGRSFRVGVCWLSGLTYDNLHSAINLRARVSAQRFFKILFKRISVFVKGYTSYTSFVFLLSCTLPCASLLWVCVCVCLSLFANQVD